MLFQTHRADLNINHLSGAEEKRKLRFFLMLTRFLSMSWKIEGQTGNVVNNSDLQEVFAGSNPAHSTHLSSTEERKHG